MIPFLRDNSVVFLGLLSWFIAQLIKVYYRGFHPPQDQLEALF